MLFAFFFYYSGDHRDLHVLTHSFPTRRSSDLQFLIYSEANLRGVLARLATDSSAAATPSAGPTTVASHHEATGTVKTITPTDITISHGPVPSIGWPAMTMTFKVIDPGLTREIGRAHV